MSRVFLINIGANSRHSSVARSPRFSNGSFIFVPFPNAGGHWIRNYPRLCGPFVRATSLDTHDDPDWANLTYGDDCANGRARALKQVIHGDILLFWGMLWGNRGNSWDDFDGSYGWYLFGAFRVAEIVFGGDVLLRHNQNTYNVLSETCILRSVHCRRRIACLSQTRYTRHNSFVRSTSKSIAKMA